jgi:hypothetical protein
MFNFLESEVSFSTEKVLIYCDNNHVQKRIVDRAGPVKRLGMHLAEQFGDDVVKSVRFLYKDCTFNGLGLAVKDVLPHLNDVIILPDDGPIKGDTQVTATDYVVIDPMSHSTLLNIRKKKISL